MALEPVIREEEGTVLSPASCGCMNVVPGSRWTSFVADPDRRRILHEDGRRPWTVLAVDRGSRRYAVAQGETKERATRDAADALTRLIAE